MSIRDKLLSGPMGFGAAPLGNMFRNIPDEEAAATVETAWRQGTRFFDTAPFYGAGLSEIRLGKELAKHRIAEDYAALNATIPGDFWREMREQRLVAPNAPLPIDR